MRKLSLRLAASVFACMQLLPAQYTGEPAQLMNGFSIYLLPSAVGLHSFDAIHIRRRANDDYVVVAGATVPNGQSQLAAFLRSPTGTFTRTNHFDQITRPNDIEVTLAPNRLVAVLFRNGVGMLFSTRTSDNVPFTTTQPVTGLRPNAYAPALCLRNGILKLITCVVGSPPTVEVQDFDPQTGVASAGYTLRPPPAGPGTVFGATAVISDVRTGEAQGLLVAERTTFNIQQRWHFSPTIAASATDGNSQFKPFVDAPRGNVSYGATQDGGGRILFTCFPILGQNPTFPHCLLSANLMAVVNSRASAGRVELTMYSSPRVVGFMALGALGSQGVALPSILRGRIGLDLASWVALPVQQFSDSGEVRYTGEFRGFRVADAQGYALDPSGSSFVASNTGLVVE
jgi:hypothetical protein